MINERKWTFVKESDSFRLYHCQEDKGMILTDNEGNVLAEGIWGDDWFDMNAELQAILDKADAEGVFNCDAE